MRRSEANRLAKTLAEKLGSARLQEVRAPTPRCVVLSLRVPGETVHLLLEAGTDTASFHTVARPPPNPVQSTALQGLLRKELSGRLAAVVLDDALHLAFEGRSGARSLVWTGGRGGAIRLLEGDRTLGGSPEGSGGTAPTGDDRLGPDPDAGARILFEALRRTSALESARGELARHLRSRRKATRRLLAKRTAEADRGGEAEELRRRADLLQGSFHLLRRGLDAVEVPDWHHGGRATTVPLDPALGPAEQVERLYRRARRFERAGVEAAARREEAQARLDALTRASARLPEVTDEAGLRDIVAELPPPLRPRVRGGGGGRKQQQRSSPWRTWRTRAGRLILAGRGARENDELTQRVANGNDLWLHVRGRPGAHVIVQRPGDAPSPELIRLAAQVAIVQSGVPDGEAVDVAWTRAKHVVKRKGMAPGKVLVTQERVLHLRADRSALEVLERVD